MDTLQLTGTYVLVDLRCCGFRFGAPNGWFKTRKGDHKTFWCPNCGSERHYPEMTELDRVREDYQATIGERNNFCRQLDAVSRSRAAIRGHVTRAKRRALEPTDD